MARHRQKPEKRGATAAEFKPQGFPIQPTSQPKPLPELSVLAILVLMSGCAALVLQVAWMRELRLVFGATTASVAAVLAIFMAGLGLGSAILGRWADRVLNPLGMYGWFEVGIACSAAISPFLIDLTGSWYLAWGGQHGLGLAGATLARLSLAIVIMAIPTFLMGGTLPAIVRSATPARDVKRRGLGILYGANTIGAVLGSAAATFYSLENFGTRTTLWAGCCLGLLAGTLAIIKSRQVRLMGANDDNDEYEPAAAAISQVMADPTKLPSQKSVSEELSPVRSHSETNARSHRLMIYVVAGVVGCAFFALEIVWYRMLAPILGGTTYTFGLILCVALAGIGLGGLFYHLLFRVIRPSYTALAVTLGCEAMLAIVPYALGDRLAIWAGAMSQSATGFGMLVWGWVLIAGVVAFPVAFISGIQFPLLIALLGQGRREVSQHIGTAYAWNTGGSIVGSLAAGFGGLPMLGALGLWRGIAVALAAMCVVVVVRSARSLPAMGIAGVLVAITLGCLFATGPTAAWRHSGIGAARTRVPADNVNQLQNWSNNRRRSLVWEADGVESSVGLVTNDGLSFFVNGKNDGNALRDAPTQMGMAILGAVLHPQPKQALVVGLGTGETAGWLAEMRGMESVEVLEIEPAVDEMARRSHRLNWDVLNHPRVRRIYNDAREHMLTVRKDYDVIVSEPSNPYRAGIATLYTQEFYRAVFQRLREDGVFVQFVQAYEIDVETVEIVLATIRSVFPHVEIWQTGRSDMQLICYKRAVEYNVDELKRRLGCPVVRDAMRRAWYVEGVEGFMAQLVAASALADEVQRRPSSLLNTDDRTVLEYRFAKTVGMMTPFSLDTLRMHIAADGLHRVKFSGSPPDWDLIELHQHETSLMHRSFTPNSLVADGERRQVVQALSFYDQHDFAQVVAIWPASLRPPRNEIQQLVLAHAYAELGREESRKLLDEVMARCPAECEALRAVYFNRIGDIQSATDELVRLFTRLADDPWMMTVFLDPALGAAIDVARADPSAAARIAATLVRPFAEYRYEPFRVMLRIRVAQHAGPEILAAAFADLEPNPEWTAELLELRAATYRAVQHPLAPSAERDWQKFQRSAKNSEPSNE